MRFIGLVESSSKVGISDLDALLSAEGALMCEVKTDEYLLTGNFFPTKWGGNFGTDVVGFNGKFVDAEDNSEKTAYLLYDPAESELWQLHFAS